MSDAHADTGDIAEVPPENRLDADPDDREHDALEGGDDTEGLADLDPGQVRFLDEEG